jgi:hypothetical protein
MKAPRQKRLSLTGIVSAIGLLCSVVLLCEVTLSISCGLSLFFPRGRQGEHDHDAHQSLTASESSTPDVIVLTALVVTSSTLAVAACGLCSRPVRAPCEAEAGMMETLCC